MTDMTMIYAMTFRVAMILAGLALTAYEFRRMSKQQLRRNPLALQTAREMRPAQVRTWRTR
jgi:uncharacterized protein YneF (UPF0154 family)